MSKKIAVPRSIRVPLELNYRMLRVVDGERYDSVAQFIEIAVRRLVMFEEKEMRRKRVREKGEGEGVRLIEVDNNRNEGGECVR
jgi:Arc/MetJ-type ribon-helix-helix transcriptional regulator